jgi:AraC-like DNA-binding protein
LDSCSRNLSGFDQQLHAQYGSFASAPVCEGGNADGSTVPGKCGPYHALMIQARNLVSRRPSMADEWMDYAFLLLLLDGESDITHYGRSQHLVQGDVFLMDSRAPLEIAIPSQTKSVCISIERSDIVALARQPEDLFGLKISGGQGLPSLLGHMLRALLNDPHSYEDPERRVVNGSVLSIIDQHLLGTRCERTPADSESDLIRRIKAWIVNNLDEAEFDVADIARHFNMSRSSLYRLFATMGATPKSWIMGQRLNLARDKLSDPRHKHLSISTICFRSGFNDAAHFSRLFRQNFGISPNEYRKENILQPQLTKSKH